MLINEALRLGDAPRLALVGAGGKTTALFRLGRELLARAPHPDTYTVIATATTHLGIEQARWADHHYIVRQPVDVDAYAAELPAGIVLFTGSESGEERLEGVSLGVLERIRVLADAHNIPLLIEADGSRMKPVKAPAEHEPVIPPFVDTVVVLAGLSALGKPLATEWVHRAEIFAGLAGLPQGSPITPEALTRVLNHPQGGLKSIPDGARRLAFLNQADTPELQSVAGAMAKQLLSSFEAVVIAALYPSAPQQPSSPSPSTLPVVSSPVIAVYEPIAGVILAAGESRRYGQPKALLPWRGEPFIRHVIRAARRAGLSPVIVVGGAHTPQIRLACADMDAQLVHNPDWEEGQSASLRVGLSALTAQVGAAVFLLADQPQVPNGLVTALVEAHAAGLPTIVAPLVDGQRANPVLFDRRAFPELMTLRGEMGGRALFSKYPIAWVPWHDPRILLDVDTPEDYQALLDMDLET